jgi:hypothetical protein
MAVLIPVHTLTMPPATGYLGKLTKPVRPLRLVVVSVATSCVLVLLVANPRGVRPQPTKDPACTGPAKLPKLLPLIEATEAALCWSARGRCCGPISTPVGEQLLAALQLVPSQPGPVPYDVSGAVCSILPESIGFPHPISLKMLPYLQTRPYSRCFASRMHTDPSGCNALH